MNFENLPCENEEPDPGWEPIKFESLPPWLEPSLDELEELEELDELWYSL